MTIFREAASALLGATALAASILFAAPLRGRLSARRRPLPATTASPVQSLRQQLRHSLPPAPRSGVAPDQTALINCSIGSEALRALCISQFVNGGPPIGPGIVVGIG
jgi:hypothetical protein